MAETDIDILEKERNRYKILGLVCLILFFFTCGNYLIYEDIINEIQAIHYVLMVAFILGMAYAAAFMDECARKINLLNNNSGGDNIDNNEVVE